MLFVAFLFLFVFPRPSPPWVINVIIIYHAHRLLFYHAHRESDEFFRLTGQLAQPNQDYVFSKRAAFFNGLTNKVGHIMARVSALRLNLNRQPSASSLPRPSARNKHAHHLCALNLSHHILPP